MSASQPENGPELFQLGRDHKELRETMSEFATLLARLEGKIDAQTQMMERFSDRQDRAETRIERVEHEYRSENRRLEDKLTALSKNVWMGMGAIALASVFVPIIVKFLQVTP